MTITAKEMRAIAEAKILADKHTKEQLSIKYVKENILPVIKGNAEKGHYSAMFPPIEADVSLSVIRSELESGGFTVSDNLTGYFKVMW